MPAWPISRLAAPLPYSHDLAARLETLVRAGVAMTAIGDGSPGPRQEMPVADRDGYSLMIAQIERA